MAYNKNKRIELENTEKTLLSLLNVIKKINEAMDPNIIKKYKDEFKKLNNDLIKDYKLDITNASIDAINKRIYQVRQDILKDIKGSKSSVNRQDAALDALFNDLVQSEIKKYRQKIEDAYENMSEKERKRIGSKKDYVNKWTNQFANQFTRNVGDNFSFTRDINSALGIGTNKKDIYNLVASTRADVSEQITRDQKKAVKTLNEAADKWSKTADIIFNATKSLWKVFSGNAGKQVSVYESTYGYLSARTDLNQSIYRSKQWSTAQDLLFGGLGSNVATSEVMQMWNDLSRTGMNSENIFATALDNVITSKILPYLDTTSASLNLLNTRLNNNFIKDIRGINLANLDIAGNNYVTQDLLQTIIDQVQPMSDEALANLAEGSTEVTALINKMIASGVDAESAKAYATQVFKAQRYSDEMLRSGSTMDQLFITDLLRNDVNLYNPSEWNDAAGLLLGRQQQLLQGFNYNNTYSGMLTNLYGRSLGIDYGMANAAINLNKKGITAQSLINASNLTPSQYAQYGAIATSNFSQGQYQTASQRQSILMENLSTGVATIEELIGSYGISIVSTLKDIIRTIIGTGTGNTLSSALAAGKFGALLSSAGPIASGVGTVAATVGTVAAITGAIYHIQRGENEDNAFGYSSRLQSLNTASSFDTGNLSFKDLVNNTNEAQGRGNTGIFAGATEINMYKDKNGNIHTGPVNESDYSLLSVFNSRSSQVAKELGFITNPFLQGEDEALNTLAFFAKHKSAERYNNIKAAALSLAVTNHKDTLKMSLLHAALLVQGYENKIYNDPNITNPLSTYLGLNLSGDKNYISSYLAAAGITNYSDLQTVYDWLGNKATDFYLMKGNGKFYGYPSGSDVSKIKKDFNLHRQGLAKVPFDEYPALLHAGETVMTASSTATMENMIQEFRNSQNQNYSLDTAIQNQTTQLLQKMDEIIHNMLLIGANNTPVNSASEKIRHSMSSLTSTLSFQN